MSPIPIPTINLGPQFVALPTLSPWPKFCGITALSDAILAPLRKLERQVTWSAGNLFAVPRRSVDRARPIDWAEVERQWRDTPPPAPAPLSLQTKYDQWAAGRQQLPTRADDRQWARDHGISTRRVAALRASNSEPRLHQRGARSK